MMQWMNRQAMMGSEGIIEMHRRSSCYHKYMLNAFVVAGIGYVVSDSH